MPSDRDRQMLELIELDYKNTSEFVRGVLSTAATVRGWAITVWLAIVGFSVQQDEPLLAVLAGLVVAGFFVVDAYHLDLYRLALRHLQRVERLYSDLYGALARAGLDAATLDDFKIELEAHRFGFYRQLTPPTLRSLLQVRPRVFAWLYAVLVAISVATALLEIVAL